jgi:flagellar FliL protein
MAETPKQDPTAAPTAAPPPAGKKSKKLMIMGLAALLVAGGGGAGAYFFYFKAAPAQAQEAEPEPPAPTGIIPMEPFVVNLADAGGSRFLRVTLSLVLADEEHAKEFEENAVEKARIRSAILELLAQQQADMLVTPEGKDQLKRSIGERAAHVVEELEVVDVLFSEFVIQF